MRFWDEVNLELLVDSVAYITAHSFRYINMRVGAHMHTNTHTQTQTEIGNLMFVCVRDRECERGKGWWQSSRRTLRGTHIR